VKARFLDNQRGDPAPTWMEATMGQGTNQNAPSFAAVVYDEGVAVDLLLAIFAERLGAQGVRVGGVLHTHRTEDHCGPHNPLQLRDVHTGRVIPLCTRAPDTRKGCLMDDTQLARAARTIDVALRERSELVFVSRFGKLELRGRGFAAQLAQAASWGCPLLTAVKRERVDDWLSFTRGLGLLLEPRLWLLSAWWREVARGPHVPHQSALSSTSK